VVLGSFILRIDCLQLQGFLSTKTAEIVDIYIVVANSEASSPVDCKNQESIFT
jgi:hypothetical protein